MKKLLKVLLLTILCVVLLAACQTVPTDDPNGDVNPPVEDTTPITLVKADKTSDYSIYISENAASSMQEVLDAFGAKVSKLTGLSKLRVWPIKATADNDFEIVVNLEDERSDAAESWKNTKLTDYRLSRNGNRVIITARHNTALETVLEHLYNSIKKDDAGNWIVEAANLKLTGTWIQTSDYSDPSTFDQYVAEINAIPAFESAGTMHPVYPLAEDGYQYAYINATKAEYDAYVKKLTDAGFTLYSTKELPGAKSGDVNVYGTYTKDNIHVFASWQGSTKVARVTFMPPAILPELTAPKKTTPVVDPTITQMQLDVTGGTNGGGSGMSYVIQMADGKFVLIDGGSASKVDAELLDSFVREKAIEAGYKKPVIAMWFFTHSHDDHIGNVRYNLLETAKNNGYTVEKFAYNFPVQDHIDFEVHPLEDTSGTILSLEINMKRFFPNTPIYTPHAGQVYYFQGAEMEILATEEEVYPLAKMGTHNGSCVTARFKFDNGKTAMFWADNHPGINEQLAKVYGSYLKSDVLQVAHHGLTGAEMTSYQFINPDICFWPTTEARFSGTYDSQGDGNLNNDDQWCIGYQFREDSKTGKTVKYLISAPNVWLREIVDVEILEDGSYVVHFDPNAYRKHYHASQTTTINMYDLDAAPDIFVSVKPEA